MPYLIDGYLSRPSRCLAVEYRIYNYRFAEEIFQSQEFQEIKYQLLDIVKLAPHLRRKTSKKRGTPFVTDPDAMNSWFKQEFRKRDWEIDPFVADPSVTGLRADYKRKRVQVEVQFSNVARAIYDVFKMQVSYSQGLIDVGVLIVPRQSFAETIGQNIASFERLARELPYAKMSITLPLFSYRNRSKDNRQESFGMILSQPSGAVDSQV